MSLFFQTHFQDGAASSGPPCPSITLGDNWTFGYVGVVFDPTAQSVSGVDGPHTIEVTSGSIPAGLTIDAETYESSPGNWVFEMFGTPTTFGRYTFTVGGTDVNGCPITPKEYIIDIKQYFYNLDLNPISSGSNLVGVDVSGLPFPYGNGVALESIQLFVEKVDNGFIMAMGLSDPANLATYFIISSNDLQGENVGPTTIYDAGFPIISTGTAPYNGDFIGDDGQTFADRFNGLDANGIWNFYLESFDSTGNITTVTLLFKPI